MLSSWIIPPPPKKKYSHHSKIPHLRHYVMCRLDQRISQAMWDFSGSCSGKTPAVAAGVKRAPPGNPNMCHGAELECQGSRQAQTLSQHPLACRLLDKASIMTEKCLDFCYTNASWSAWSEFPETWTMSTSTSERLSLSHIIISSRSSGITVSMFW